ncbi:MAG: DNA-binding protein [Ruminococcus flavefaciens]|nr:DNA-binding protein [Ruminococcus flavefaciens]
MFSSDECVLTLFLNAEVLAKALGVPPSSNCELLHLPDCLSLRIVNCIVKPKDDFVR